jgi:uncharacterized membrane protein YheB (UPF0754 family)
MDRYKNQSKSFADLRLKLGDKKQKNQVDENES